MRNFAELLKHLAAVANSRFARRLSLVVALGVLAAPSAFAQSPYMPAWGATGLPGRSSVSVDLAALDALGPSPNIASAAMSRTAAMAPRSSIAAERSADRRVAQQAPRSRHVGRRMARHGVARQHAALVDRHARRAAATPAKHRPATGETHRTGIAAALPATPPTAQKSAAEPIANREPAAPRATPPIKAAPAEAIAHNVNPHASDAGEPTGTTTVAALAAPALPRPAAAPVVPAQSAREAAPEAAPTSVAPAPTAKASMTAQTAAPVAHADVATPIQVAAMTPARPASPPPVAVPVAAPATAGAAANAVIHFTTGTSELAADAHPALNALVQRLESNQELRVQLVAYASGNDDEANQARRISLARAIAVRAYLIDQGVRGTRIDVRALGNRSIGNGPADRVDLVVLDR